ncbi:MAG: DEAD/DEAH box helicase family protein [Thermodesulfobacteriota bacterium]|nr:DEAD/DEAH box helicase family protein [Thermodesulfobacteriota bacterium]
MNNQNDFKGSRHLAVDEPIINSPFEEPKQYWVYDAFTGQPAKVPGRRPAHYYFRSRRRADAAQISLFADEEMVELESVNKIRNRVKKWREGGYKNVGHITRQLLRHWTYPDREKKLFFCQLEAAETIIWLNEIHKSGRHGLKIPYDEPLEEGFQDLRRQCLKMATGSGKTVVMAMIIAWSVLNKVHNRQARWCSDTVLLVCPNLTIKERLGGTPKGQNGSTEPERALVAGAKGNYYDKFDLVPSSLKEYLGQAKLLITNWHQFAEIDDRRKRSIIQRGVESPSAFCNRVLRELGSARNILVLNDEAHHAYRPAPVDENNRKKTKLTAEEKKTREKATVWISALDKINKAREINLVVDLSATPFYIQGSGYPEGSPFPWIVSDFGLVDSIECGIVKIPQVPVDSNSGRPIPEYFALWKWINDRLPARERATGRRKPKPEAILREADGALKQLAGQWKAKYEEFKSINHPVPPTMIIVCDNTNIAELLHEYVSGERWEKYQDEKGKKRKRKVYGTGGVLPELLSNNERLENTIRIDSKLLNEAEERDDGQTKEDAAESLRKKISTVGKVGEPGQDIRCIVSVSMLTEGWDAQNVTQILGLRAFLSQLLCEQVIGRGLRRTQYDDFAVPEYVDVYGIPFEVIPVKKKPVGPAPPPTKTTLIQSLSEREHLKIEFPRVEGFVYQIKSKIRADVGNIEPLSIDPNIEPTETVVRARVGYQVGSPGLVGPGEKVTQTREAFYESIRPQQIHYEISRRITASLLNQDDFKMQARQMLFPQVLQIVRQYAKPLSEGGRIEYNAIDSREIGLERYVQIIVERLCTAIRPDEGSGESPLLPRLERFRPRGSTQEVLFRTSRQAKQTIKSHVSHVVLDTKTWERSVAFHLEQSELVESYVRNDHLDFTIDYEFNGSQHSYMPDFLVRLKNGTNLILEVKGFEDEQARAKHEAAKRWCDAVSDWGEMEKWKFDVCRDPKKLKGLLGK